MYVDYDIIINYAQPLTVMLYFPYKKSDHILYIFVKVYSKIKITNHLARIVLAHVTYRHKILSFKHSLYSVIRHLNITFI